VPDVTLEAAPNDRADGVVAFGRFSLSLRARRLERDGQAVKLGSRALDILIALVERAPAVVATRELMTRVWPDTVVEDNNLRVHIASLRKALGEGHVTNIPGRGYCFVSPVVHTPTPAAASPASSRDHRSNVPSRLARVIGREELLGELVDHVARDRLVTITGSGGMGKTTVAIAVAHALLAELDGDACFVDVAALGDARQVLTAIAASLEVSLHSEDAVASLIAYVQTRHALILLDNCEHLVGVIAPLVERLVSETSRVHVLATSREPLRVAGERVFRMGPLAGPLAADGLTAADAMTFPAIQLFVDRAIASGARTVLTDEDAPIVAQICQGLDGIPLAIELAAGRVEAYGIPGLARLIANRFKLLWQGRRTALARHQTLGSMLDWSYNLLSSVERTVLRRLSILVGRFSLDDAAAIASDPELDHEQVVDLLGGLVDKSLISLEYDQRDLRYRLLDTTRSYASAKLDEHRERPVIAHRHARRLCDYLARELANLDGAQDTLSVLGNVRAALTWAFSEQGDPHLGVRLASGSARLFLGLSLLRECHRWVETALEHLAEADRGTREEMELQAALGVSLMFTRGNSQATHDALSRGLAVADALDDPEQQLRLLGAFVVFHDRVGQFRESVAIARRSEPAARRSGDAAALLISDWIIGTSLHLLGDQAAAERRCRSATTAEAKLKRIAPYYYGFDHRIRGLVGLARVLWLVGRPEEAMRVAHQTIRESEDLRHPVSLAISLVWTSSVFLWSGDRGTAAGIIERLIVHAERHSLGPYVHVGLGLRGELAVKHGRPEEGLELLRRARDALREHHHGILDTVFATAQAEALGQLGRLAEAVVEIDRAIACAEHKGDSFDLAEMLRLKSSFVAAASPDEAERGCLRAIQIARAQGALGWELRAATSLARLWIARGEGRAAHALVRGLLDRFTEGLQTADLRAAQALLATIAPDAGPSR